MYYELEIYLNGEQFIHIDHPQYDERINDLLNCRKPFHGFIEECGYVEFGMYDFNYLLDYQESINKLDGFSTQIFMCYDGDGELKRYMLNQQ